MQFNLKMLFLHLELLPHCFVNFRNSFFKDRNNTFACVEEQNGSNEVALITFLSTMKL